MYLVPSPNTLNTYFPCTVDVCTNNPTSVRTPNALLQRILPSILPHSHKHTHRSINRTIDGNALGYAMDMLLLASAARAGRCGHTGGTFPIALERESTASAVSECHTVASTLDAGEDHSPPRPHPTLPYLT